MMKPENEPPFSQGQLERLAQALGHTTEGLTGPEVAHTLQKARIPDVDPSNTKWKRLYNAFVTRQNQTQTGICVVNFIHHALEPARYVGKADVFEQRREEVNTVLAFHGLQFTAEGKFARVQRAKNLTDAEQRASELRRKLRERDVHPDVLTFCRAELLEDNYFHAVLEAMKSIDAKIKNLTALDLDGAGLYDAALGGSAPLLRINSLSNKSQRSEQSGFLNLLKGLYGTFRNPVAHEPRIEWQMVEQDALDLLAIAGYVHRRLAGAGSL
jgi:uncharacterized protein (TIGR02391 family)